MTSSGRFAIENSAVQRGDQSATARWATQESLIVIHAADCSSAGAGGRRAGRERPFPRRGTGSRFDSSDEKKWSHGQSPVGFESPQMHQLCEPPPPPRSQRRARRDGKSPSTLSPRPKLLEESCAPPSMQAQGCAR